MHAMRPIDRRTFLRGAGVALALPYLDAMGLAQAKKAPPVRMAFLFVPNGVDMVNWTPASPGALELSPILQPLAPVKAEVNVVTGLAQMNAFAINDGPGDHA